MNQIFLQVHLFDRERWETHPVSKMCHRGEILSLGDTDTHSSYIFHNQNSENYAVRNSWKVLAMKKYALTWQLFFRAFIFYCRISKMKTAGFNLIIHTHTSFANPQTDTKNIHWKTIVSPWNKSNSNHQRQMANASPPFSRFTLFHLKLTND